MVDLLWHKAFYRVYNFEELVLCPVLSQKYGLPPSSLQWFDDVFCAILKVLHSLWGFLCQKHLIKLVQRVLCDIWYWIGVCFVLEVRVCMTFPLGEDVPWGLHHNSFLSLHSLFLSSDFVDASDVILGSRI